MKTIAIDARELMGKPTGVGTYLRTLLKEWSRREDCPPLRLYFRESPEESDWLRSAQFETRVISTGSRRTGVLWQQMDLARDLHHDPPGVFFSPSYTLPLLLPCAGVVAIHDLSFESRPDWFPARARHVKRFLCRRSALNASLILACSKFTRTEILRHYPVFPARVQVVPLGLAPGAGIDSEPEESLRKTIGLPGRFVVHVGSLFRRRAIVTLAEAVHALRRSEKDLRLVVVGENRSHPRIDYAHLLSEIGIEGGTVFAGYVTDSRLRGLMKYCSAALYFSEYEGFGLPPLEAMSEGVPVVCGNAEALKEVYGDVAEFLPELTPSAMETSLRRILTDGAHAARLGRAGLEKAATLNSQNFAGRTLDLIRGYC